MRAQCVHTDISQIKLLDEEGNAVTLKKKSWIICVDAATGKKWSQFVDTKKEFVPTTLGWLGLMLANDNKINSLRMDPSGENQKLAAKLLEPEYFHLQPIASLNCLIHIAKYSFFFIAATLRFLYP